VAGLPSLCLASSRIQFSVHTGGEKLAEWEIKAPRERGLGTENKGYQRDELRLRTGGKAGADFGRSFTAPP
jgi:hypothetical protein